MQRRAFIAALAAIAASGGAQPSAAERVLLAQFEPSKRPDVGFVASPDAVIERMLQMAAVTSDDVVYDLGCGDGRIPIAAARRYGARAVGIDIDPRRISEARDNARIAGVGDRVRFVEANLFDADIREATVITLYLLPALNMKLRPKLLRDLKPGARVVSHMSDMGDWEAEHWEMVGPALVMLWRIPARP